MPSNTAIRRLTREYHTLLQNPIETPQILAHPNESNVLEWHYCIIVNHNDENMYRGGYYHGKLIFPKEYPFKPPSVIMLTPNGRFQTNRRLCLSMSDFHPETWNPMWSVSTILTGLYSFMVESAPTLGSIETSSATKYKLARESLKFNCQNKDFIKIFPELVELYEREKAARQVIEKHGVSDGNSKDKTITDAVHNVNGDGVQALLFGMGAGVIAILSIMFALRFF